MWHQKQSGCMVLWTGRRRACVVSTWREECLTSLCWPVCRREGRCCHDTVRWRARLVPGVTWRGWRNRLSSCGEPAAAPVLAPAPPSWWDLFSLSSTSGSALALMPVVCGASLRDAGWRTVVSSTPEVTFFSTVVDLSVPSLGNCWKLLRIFAFVFSGKFDTGLAAEII